VSYVRVECSILGLVEGKNRACMVPRDELLIREKLASERAKLTSASGALEHFGTLEAVSRLVASHRRPEIESLQVFHSLLLPKAPRKLIEKCNKFSINYIF
jgi:hypothetical protein